MGIRQQALDGRIEIALDFVDIDIPPGQNAGEQFIEAMSLGNRQSARRTALVKTILPGPPAERAFDAKEIALA